jgi:LysM repeat protein
MKKLMFLFSIAICSAAAFAQVGTDPYPTKVVDGIKYRVHTVSKGETLYKISKSYACTVDELTKLNKNSASIKPGDALLIPIKGSAATKPTNATAVVNVKNHTVKKGETLNKIAKAYGISVADLKSANGFTSDEIRIGQIIKIPVKSVVAVTPVTPVKPEPKDTVRTPAPKPKVEKSPKTEVNPGIPEKPVAITVDVMKEKEDLLQARVVSGKMEDQRMYMMHPSIPKGSIVEVIHSGTGRMAYCRVVDNYNPSEYQDAGLILTPAVADKIGLSGMSGEVKIRYATP